MTYKFPQFNVEIVNPTVTIVTVNDSIQLNTCNVEVLLSTQSANFGISFNGFTYVTDWNDTDIALWVNEQLIKYEV